MATFIALRRFTTLYPRIAKLELPTYVRRYSNKGLLQLQYFTYNLYIGFDKFKQGKKRSTQTSKDTGTSQTKQEGTGGGGGGGGPSSGKGGDWWSKNWLEEAMKPQYRGTWLSLLAAVGAGYMLTRTSNEGRQISWQEFRTHYLEKGEV